MKKGLFFIFFLLVAQMAAGQYVVLNDSVDSFGDQVAALLERTNNAEADSIGQDFSALWPSSFSPAQQQKIMDIAIAIQEHKMPHIPYFRDFFGMLAAGVNLRGLSGNKLDNLLKMLSTSLERNKPRNFSRELINLRIFFEKEMLHYSRFNRLYVLNADYDFEFAEETVEPTLEEKIAQVKEEPEEDSWGEETEDGWGDEVDDGWGETTDNWGDENADTGWGAEEDQTTDWATTEESEESQSNIALSFENNYLEEDLPAREGALIAFSKADLVMATPYDSIIIGQVTGAFLLDKYIFLGDGGKVDWSSAGLAPEDVFVQLDKYSFNTRNPYLEASNVGLTYRGKIDEEANGYFEFKSVRHDSVTDAKYPKFISYENNIVLKGLGDEHLRFTGGIMLEGGRLFAASAYGRDSKLEYIDPDGQKFKIRSKLFDFADSSITAYHSKMTIYQGRDSITHPSVKFRYYTNTKEFVVIKDKNGYNLRPFDASYYKMTIDADMIRWDMNSDSLNISILNAKSLLPAYFKSTNYYDFKEIKELTGVYNFNPLMVVYSYGARIKSREMYVSNIIQDLKLNEKAVRGAMQQLMYLDFIEYDNISGRIYLKDKAIHYVRSKNNRKDYDDLMIPSLSTYKPNATLHFDNNELTVRGIDKFFISEILDVYIYPRNNEINLLKNRDFKFDGQLFAGNFEFVGRNFTFRYDSFLVDLLNIDSVRFYVDGESQYEKKRIDNKLVSLELENDKIPDLTTTTSTSGTLYINKPENKSGRKIYPQYPIFDADRGAIVYFDTDETLDGVYDKSIYFIVPPFGIDSLSSSDPATIGFEGTFVSGGIFPEFKEKLKIMPDYSLGFEHTVPQEGFELYGGPGKLYNKIKMDKNGLTGNGKIEFLASSFHSENYTFYLDSVIAEGTNFKLEEGELNGVSYPDIYTDNFTMKWLPGEDHMYIRNQLDSFMLYDNTATLSGYLDVTTTGVKGGGTMTTRGFESQSEDFTFTQYQLIAKNSSFTLASDNPEKPLLTGDDIRLEFDFTKDVANISPEIEGMAAIDFPYAQIKTSISKAQWNLQENKVYMTKPPDVPIDNSYFYATRKELDSLAFNAESAVYDLESSELKVMGIPYIIVADAMITPENNEVLILENAQIGELHNTTLVIDTLYGYHHLIDGTIQIHSRKSFSGHATYQFVNALKDTFNIKFGRFELWKDPSRKDATLQTVSSGVITKDDRLIISEGMYYKGDVTMYARSKALKLDGYVKFALSSSRDFDTWIKYSSEDEQTQDVMFDFNNAITEDGSLLNAGIHYGSMDNDLYVTFAEEKRLETDEDFFTPSGILHYNRQKKMFMIEDTAKTNGNKFSGRVFGYNDNTGDVEFEGPLNFVESTEEARLTASGFGSGNANDESFTINTLLKFDFKLPDQALASMASDMFEVIENFGFPEAENDPDAFLYKVSEIIGERATIEYDKRNQEEYVPIASFTPKMIGSLVFSKVLMNWSPEHKAWYSTGKLGFSNVLRADLNASIDGFIELKRTSEKGTVMHIFLQAAPDCWYYLGFEDNRLFLFSSNDNFVDIVASKSNVNKAGFGEYIFVDSDLPDVLKFVDRFRKDYLGIEQPYELNLPTETMPEQEILEIPEDNTGITDSISFEIEDNAPAQDEWDWGEPDEEQQTKPDEPAQEDQTKPADQPTTEKELLNQTKPPMSEKELLKPAETKKKQEEEDDEGF